MIWITIVHLCNFFIPNNTKNAQQKLTTFLFSYGFDKWPIWNMHDLKTFDINISTNFFPPCTYWKISSISFDRILFVLFRCFSDELRCLGLKWYDWYVNNLSKEIVPKCDLLLKIFSMLVTQKYHSPSFQNVIILW